MASGIQGLLFLDFPLMALLKSCVSGKKTGLGDQTSSHQSECASLKTRHLFNELILLLCFANKDESKYSEESTTLRRNEWIPK